MIISAPWNWYFEYVDPYSGCFFAIKRYLYSGKTPYQRVEIVDTETYGRLLILDGKVQSAAFDEYIYHEALVHPAMVLHPDPRRVLLIGSGEGAGLREILRHAEVRHVTMVDIDRQVVELCREHLSSWHQGSFEDPRVKLHFIDAWRYLEKTKEQFEIIISDLTEPEAKGPSALLYTRRFYELVKERLAPGGIFALQAGGLSIDYLAMHRQVRHNLGPVFRKVRSYHTYIPSFDSSWGFIIASDHQDPLALDREEVDRRLTGVARQLRFYDGETHEGLFCLSKDIRRAFAENSSGPGDK
ncbi:MAG: polyamine aminopropyltransferase [Dethiobacteria bacterium]